VIFGLRFIYFAESILKYLGCVKLIFLKKCEIYIKLSFPDVISTNMLIRKIFFIFKNTVPFQE